MEDKPKQEKGFLGDIHRDDIDMDFMQEFEKAMKEKHGESTKVVCAGDISGELPPEVAEQIEAINEKMKETFLKGLCWDCGKQMPDWPPPEDDEAFEKWDKTEGWSTLNSMIDGQEEITGFVCPECTAEEEQGPSIQLLD